MNQEDNNQMPPPAPEPGSEEFQDNRLTVPFEDPSLDFFTGMFETMKLVLLKPQDFFKNYNLDNKITKSMLFGVIIGWIATIVDTIWGLLINQSIFTVIGERMSDIEGFDSSAFSSHMAAGGVQAIMTMIFAPVAILIGMFIAAGIYHGFLMLFKGATKKFDTTFNVVAYGMASNIIKIIPFCGSLFALIYGLVLAAIGLKETHKTDTWKAVMAVLGPIIACCLCCVLFIFLMGGLGAMAGMANN